MKQCYFCTNNLKTVDFKATETLKKFLGPQSKILGKRHTGVCAKHQRKLAKAIKQSRVMALLPFVSH